VERTRLEHRLISFLPVDASFSAGQYAELAHAEIDQLLRDGQRPIVVGGTGLYLRAALTELSLRSAPPAGVRERWLAELDRRGAARQRRRRLGHRPESPGIRRAAGPRCRGDEATDAQLRSPPADLDAQAVRGERHRRDRPSPGAGGRGNRVALVALMRSRRG